MKTVVRVLLIAYFCNGFSVQIDSEPLVYYPGYYAGEVTDQFIEEVRQNLNLQCRATGGSMPYDILSISVNFGADRYDTIEGTRKLLVSLVRRFEKIINSHEKIRPFLRDYPFPPNRIHVSVCFWLKHESDNIAPDNYVDYVSCIKGSIHYEQRDVELKRESYEEARSIVQRSQI